MYDWLTNKAWKRGDIPRVCETCGKKFPWEPGMSPVRNRCNPCKDESDQRYRDGWRVWNRQQQRKWRLANPKKVRAQQKRYAAEHPEILRATKRASAAKRRRGMRGLPGPTGADVRRLLKLQKHTCWWCGEDVGNVYHLDHRFPLARGGDNDPGNFVISCPACNQSKHTMLPVEFAGRIL